MFLGIRSWRRLEIWTIRRRRRPPRHSRIAAAPIERTRANFPCKHILIRVDRRRTQALNWIRYEAQAAGTNIMEVWCGWRWPLPLRFRRLLERFKAAFRRRLLFSTLEADRALRSEGRRSEIIKFTHKPCLVSALNWQRWLAEIILLDQVVVSRHYVSCRILLCTRAAVHACVILILMHVQETTKREFLVGHYKRSDFLDYHWKTSFVL
jgi:hypothetical protein